MVGRDYAIMERVARSTLAIRARVPLALLIDAIQPVPTFSEAFHVESAELANRVPAGAR